MDDFEDRSNAFLQWFRSQPGASFHPSLRITDLRPRQAGRGIVASQDIPAGTELFSISRKSVISVENSVLSQKLPTVFSTTDDDQNAEVEEDDAVVEDASGLWLDLILVMIYEYLQGESSAWKKYFDVLPQSFETPMFWNDNELAELQASAMKEKIGKHDADQIFQQKIVPVVKIHQDVFYSSGASALHDDELLHLAHRIGSIIMAYAFDLENEDEDEVEEDGWVQDMEGKTAMGMVPMADMLNADAEFNAHLDHGDEKLTMTSLRPIRAGEEVLNYYGPLPNSDLLRRYGYTSKKHSRYDVVEMPWELVKKAISDHFGGNTEPDPPPEDLGLEEYEESFVLERETADPDNTGLFISEATFTAFPPELLEQVVQYCAFKMNMHLDETRRSKVDQSRLQMTLLEVMDKAILARLKQYATTKEQDEDLLEDSNVAGRVRMAIEVRLGEKRLLQEVQDHTRRLLGIHKRANDESDQPLKKRPKTSR